MCFLSPRYHSSRASSGESTHCHRHKSQKSEAKHDNTCLCHVWARTAAKLRFILGCYLNSRHLYEPNYCLLCCRKWDNKCICVCSWVRSSSLHFAYYMTCIYVLWSIIKVYATLEALVVLRNRIFWGALLLTLHTWHFPLCHEGVQKPVIGGLRHAYTMYSKTLELILCRLDKFPWFLAHPCCISTTK